MKKMYLLLSLFALSLAPSAGAQDGEPPPALLEELQKGGFVIFFRHAATNQNHKDTDPDDLENCAAQRNLTEQGRGQARAIGDAFRALTIPVGDIVSSHYCRCLDTLRIPFGHAKPSVDLTSIVGVSEAERQRRILAIKRMLSAPTQAGKNTLLVSHRFMLHDASGLWLKEGEAGIARPLGNGRFEIVGQIAPEDWTALAVRFGKTVQSAVP